MYVSLRTNTSITYQVIGSGWNGRAEIALGEIPVLHVVHRLEQGATEKRRDDKRRDEKRREEKRLSDEKTNARIHDQ